MFWIALPLTMAYVGLCGLMYVRQRDLVYCPAPTRVEVEQTNFALVNGDITLRGWIVNPGQKRALVYFGGNSEPIQQHRVNFARWFPHHTCYLVAYRGFGASEGEPSEESLAGDALALFDHVRRQHPRTGVDVIGYSLGSGVAAHVAARRRVRRLALITPYDTLTDIGQFHYRWLPVRLLARERYDSVSNLARHRGPILVVRAGRDAVIPAANTQRLIDSLPRPPHVLELPAAEHGNVASARGFSKALRVFFTAQTLTYTPNTRKGRHSDLRRPNLAHSSPAHPNPYPFRRTST
ncbi:alpha/beta hydrolase [Lysobacter terrae]